MKADDLYIPGKELDAVVVDAQQHLRRKVPELIYQLKRCRAEGGTIMPTKRLASKLRISTRDLRKLVNFAGTKLDIPVFGTMDKPRGYILCLTAEEIETYSLPIRGLLRSIGARVRGSERAARKLRLRTQLSFDLEVWNG